MGTWRGRLLLWFVAVTAAASGMAMAQAPYLVKDINLVQNSQAGSSPGPFVAAGGLTYFTASESKVGGELFRTDGTAAGTMLVRDIVPGDGGCFPSALTDLNGTLFFTAFDPVHGGELWKTDGTAAGTILVKDIIPGTGGGAPGQLTVIGSTLFFSAYDPDAGQELWKTDGTEAGTVMVKDINPGPDGSNLASFAVLNGALFFSAFTPGTGQELWTSDGTEAGTTLVADIAAGPDGGYPNSPLVYDGALFFRAQTAAAGAELWKTDGTTAGTMLAQDVLPGPDSTYPSPLATSGGLLYFLTYDSTIFTSALWKTDGSVGGATLVRSGFPYGGPSSFTDVNGTLFFTAPNTITYQNELWTSDGTAAGTVQLIPPAVGFAPVPGRLVNLGGALLLAAYDFDHGMELWRSDGTPAGTVMIKDILPGFNDSNPASPANIGGTLMFSASDGIHGPELWTSDGTAAGTTLLRDIEGGDAGSFPTSFAELGGDAFFIALDPAPGLWKSDGTEAGTTLVVSGPDYPWMTPFFNVNGSLLFAARDADHGGELWRSDGTAAGTALLKDINPGPDWSNPYGLVRSNGTLFFQAADPLHGTELWKSDGTEAGTVPVLDVGGAADGLYPSFLFDVNGTLFFMGRGVELWKSDGTEAGTVPVPGAPAGIIGGTFANADGTLFFFAFDYGTFTYSLWKSDGSGPGTTLVKPGFDNIQEARAAGPTLFFSAFSYATFSTDLWKSDGTEAGTVPVSPSPSWTAPAALTAVGGRLFFTAFDAAHGTELFTSDGTEAGTGLVSDITPGPDGSNPVNLAAVNGVLYFGATDPGHGGELWVSDGTEAGTTMVGDLSPGLGGSNPFGMIAIGPRIFFSADGSVFGQPHNRELWAIAACSLPDDNCNGIDEDCDGVPDDGYLPLPTTCGTGACAATGTTACVAGAEQNACVPGTPSPETCDLIDNDCDGLVDEDFPDGCACVLAPAGLVGWWPADGNTLDIQGGNNGTPDGPLGYAPGRVGQAFSYSLSYPFVLGIGAPATYSFVQDTGVFTVMAWMRLASPDAAAQRGLIGNSASTTQKGYAFLWENSDGLARLRLLITDGTPGAPVIDSYSPPGAVADGGWHHVAAVGDGVHVTFYVDGGALPGSGTIGTLSLGDSTNPMVIGGCWLSCGFHGQIDEAQIYDRALASGEVRAIAAAGGHGLCRCTDEDGDGYGAGGSPACPAGPAPDCDDTGASIHPGAPDDTCDGIDNDCDGQADEDSAWACLCRQPGPGLVGWWTGDGDALDIRGAHHGTLENGAAFGAGRVGQAFRLDGIDDYVDGIGVPSTFAFIQDTAVFTIDAWISLDDPGALVDQAITLNGLGGSDTGHLFEWVNSGGEQALRIHVMSGRPGDPVILSASPDHVITTGGWHHVAVVGDGARVTFYVDGASFPGNGTMSAVAAGDSAHALHIGGPGFYPALKFAGLIDEVRIWNRALGASEIVALETAGTDGPCRCSDFDGDGFGAEAGLSCSRGALLDCDDTSAGAWGVPVEVTGLGLVPQPSTTLSWSGQAAIVGPGVAYDILRGALNLPVGSAGEVCLGPIAGTGTADATAPALGQGFWYLVRARNTCGAGTYGTRSNGTPRISSACP